MSDNICNICNFWRTNIQLIPCNHIFHARCIYPWPINSCPICNHSIESISCLKIMPCLKINNPKRSLYINNIQIFGIQRKGKWITYETEYANLLRELFVSGTIPISNDTKITSFLCHLLQCSSARLRSKIKTGKRVYHNHIINKDISQAEINHYYNSQKKLSELEENFIHSSAINTTTSEEAVILSYQLQRHWLIHFVNSWSKKYIITHNNTETIYQSLVNVVTYNNILCLTHITSLHDIKQYFDQIVKSHYSLYGIVMSLSNKTNLLYSSNFTRLINYLSHDIDVTNNHINITEISNIFSNHIDFIDCLTIFDDMTNRFHSSCVLLPNNQQLQRSNVYTHRFVDLYSIMLEDVIRCEMILCFNLELNVSIATFRFVEISIRDTVMILPTMSMNHASTIENKPQKRGHSLEDLMSQYPPTGNTTNYANNQSNFSNGYTNNYPSNQHTNYTSNYPTNQSSNYSAKYPSDFLTTNITNYSSTSLNSSDNQSTINTSIIPVHSTSYDDLLSICSTVSEPAHIHTDSHTNTNSNNSVSSSTSDNDPASHTNSTSTTTSAINTTNTTTNTNTNNNSNNTIFLTKPTSYSSKAMTIEEALGSFNDSYVYDVTDSNDSTITTSSDDNNPITNQLIKEMEENINSLSIDTDTSQKNNKSNINNNLIHVARPKLISTVTSYKTISGIDLPANFLKGTTLYRQPSQSIGSVDATLKSMLKFIPFDIIELWVPVVMPDNNTMLLFAGSAAADNDLSTWASYSRSFMFDATVGLPGRVSTKHRPECVPDVCDVSNYKYLRVNGARSLGIHASVGLPIPTVKSGDFDAVIVFYSKQKFDPKPELVDYLTKLLESMKIKATIKSQSIQKLF